MQAVDFSESYLADDVERSKDSMLSFRHPGFEKLDEVLSLFDNFMSTQPIPVIDKRYFELFGRGQEIGVPAEVTAFFERFYPIYDHSLDGVAEYFGVRRRDLYVRIIERYLNFCQIITVVRERPLDLAGIKSIITEEVREVAEIKLLHRDWLRFREGKFDCLTMPVRLLNAISGSLDSAYGNSWNDFPMEGTTINFITWETIVKLETKVSIGLNKGVSFNDYEA